MDVKRQIGELRPVSHRCDDYVSGQLDGTCASDDQLSGQEKPTFSEFLEQCEDLLVHPALAPSEDWALLPAVVAVSNASAPAADSCRVESLNCHSCAEGLASLASQVLDQTLVSSDGTACNTGSSAGSTELCPSRQQPAEGPAHVLTIRQIALAATALLAMLACLPRPAPDLMRPCKSNAYSVPEQAHAQGALRPAPNDPYAQEPTSLCEPALDMLIPRSPDAHAAHVWPPGLSHVSGLSLPPLPADLDLPDNFDPFCHPDAIDLSSDCQTSLLELVASTASPALLQGNEQQGVQHVDSQGVHHGKGPEAERHQWTHAAASASPIPGSACLEEDEALPHGATRHAGFSVEPGTGRMLQHGPALASKTPEVYVPGVQALFANFAAGLTHQASIHETELVADNIGNRGMGSVQVRPEWAELDDSAPANIPIAEMPPGHSPSGSATGVYHSVPNPTNQCSSAPAAAVPQLMNGSPDLARYMSLPVNQHRMEGHMRAASNHAPSPLEPNSANDASLKGGSFGGISSSIVSQVKRSGSQPLGIFRLEDHVRQAEQQRLLLQPIPMQYEGVERVPWGVLFNATLTTAKNKAKGVIGPFASAEEAARARHDILLRQQHHYASTTVPLIRSAGDEAGCQGHAHLATAADVQSHGRYMHQQDDIEHDSKTCSDLMDVQDVSSGDL